MGIRANRKPGDRRRSGRDRGAALVEAAMVLPILLLMTFGIWTMARAWNVSNTMEHAAREAARYGATVDPWDGSSPAAVIAVSDADLILSSIDTSLITDCAELVLDGDTRTCDGGLNSTGTDQVFVQLDYPDYPLNFLFFSFDVDLHATAVSRYEAS